MINLIKRIIYLIELEKNWRDRTSDAPKAFKVSKNAQSIPYVFNKKLARFSKYDTPFLAYRSTVKGDASMKETMTNKQFQGLLRLTIDKLKKALEESPDNNELKELIDIYQSMLEDS